ncbi:PQ loop repeat protein [compost metagenome]
MRPIEKLMYIVSLAYPLTAVPQIIKVYSTQNVESLALLSWILYVIFGTIFVIYAISEKLKPLIIEGALWVGIYVLMVGAIVMYA